MRQTKSYVRAPSKIKYQAGGSTNPFSLSGLYVYIRRARCSFHPGRKGSRPGVVAPIIPDRRP